MTAPAPPSLETTGLRRIATGAGIGLAGAVAALVLPLSFLYLSAYAPGGYFVLDARLLRTVSVLVLVGSILLLLSLFLYRRGFAALRRVDGRFAVASALCLVGTLGFLLLLVAAAFLFGSTDSLLTCVQGRPAQALHCLESGQPLGAYTALAGFLLGWIGGLGIVIGVASTGSRYRRGALTSASVVYALLLLVLVGPFLALLYAVPDVQYLLLVAPLLMVLAPGLAFAGARPALELRAASPA